MGDTSTPQHDEPLWLDEAYITKILNKFTEQQLKTIKNFTKAPATARGENYASALYLVTVEYTLADDPTSIQNISLIVKSRMDNELMSQIEEEFNIFERESQAYTVILNEAQKILKTIGDDMTFGPKAIYVDERCIVQENLKLKGYVIADVKQGLDVDQCRIVLEKLAKFHAVSMILYKKNPDMFRYHLSANVSEHPSPLHDVYINTIKSCIAYCKNNSNLRVYVPKLETFGDKIIPKMINVFSRNQTDRFHVLNHGDIWVNNIMFRKDSNGQAEDVLFVDYQEGFFGSPGIDWNYFIFSSWPIEVFQNHFDELVELYHRTLVEILHKFNFEQRIPTIEDVKKEIVNKGFHGVTTATCILPILINEHTDLADPINFLLSTDEALQNRETVFNNPKWGARLELFLKYFVDTGVL